VRHTPGDGEWSPPEHDVTEGFIALARARSDYLALDLHASSSQLWKCYKDSMLQHGSGNPISLFNYRTNSSEREMSKLKLWSD
jgi:hypothetical protein